MDTLRTGAGKTVLMVGTLEPRKGHEQALAAFERMWDLGSNARLLIVGKAGWMVEELVRRIRSHNQNGSRLFWVESASDAALAEFYRSSDLLLAASYAEGFGLPLIEAALHGLPTLARDIPVFREVAGSTAVFFTAETGEELAEAIERQLDAGTEGMRSIPGTVPTTWAESARLLMDVIEKGDWYRIWDPKKGPSEPSQTGRPAAGLRH
jgi:glycosyltransferase involved in cell wall biosynthesis